MISKNLERNITKQKDLILICINTYVTRYNLDIVWLKDESLDDLDKLPEPDVIAEELVEDLESALEQLKEISGDLNNR